MAVRIQVKNQPERYAVVRAQVITVGRDEANDLVLDEPSASDFHAEIVRHQDRVVIEDLLSQLGTFVNGDRISGPRELKAWDVVRIGATELVVNDPSQARQSGWTVSISGGHNSIQPVELVEGLIIGRDPQCDIVLTGSLISRRHTRLKVKQSVVEVQDLDSVNGTFLNGKRITSADAQHNDEVFIEPYTLCLSNTSAQTDVSEREDGTEIRAIDSTQMRDDDDRTEILAPNLPAAQLVERSNLIGQQKIDLNTAGFSIGRRVDNDIVIADPSVSKRHAKMEFADGWYIEDLGAANGVRVNQAGIERVMLRDGDVIQLGRCELVFTSAPTVQSEAAAKHRDR